MRSLSASDNARIEDAWATFIYKMTQIRMVSPDAKSAFSYEFLADRMKQVEADLSDFAEIAAREVRAVTTVDPPSEIESKNLGADLFDPITHALIEEASELRDRAYAERAA